MGGSSRPQNTRFAGRGWAVQLGNPRAPLGQTKEISCAALAILIIHGHAMPYLLVENYYEEKTANYEQSGANTKKQNFAF